MLSSEPIIRIPDQSPFAVLWLWFGIRQRDRNICLPCVGWIGMGGAVIVGARHLRI